MVFDVSRDLSRWGKPIKPQVDFSEPAQFPAYVARLTVTREDVWHKLTEENLVACDETAVDGFFQEQVLDHLHAHVTKLLTGSDKKLPEAVVVRGWGEMKTRTQTTNPVPAA